LAAHDRSELNGAVARSIGNPIIARQTVIAVCTKQVSIRHCRMPSLRDQALAVIRHCVAFLKLLLGRKAQHVTTHYSAPEIGALIEAAQKVCELESRASPAISVVRSRA
jgi:hypothetical protein